MEFRHTSVLLDEVIEYLNIKPDGVYVDGTLGGAGHAGEIVKRLTGGGRLIGIDQDADALLAAKERLLAYQDQVTLVRSNYCRMREVLKELGIEKADGILLDLGVSSYQRIYLQGRTRAFGHAYGPEGRTYSRRYCKYVL